MELPAEMGKWNTLVDGKLTFYGVLEKYYEDVSLRWNEETQRRYLTDYHEYVLPYLDDKALEDCTREDFDRIIESLPAKRRNERAERHIWVIMEYVLKVAEQKGICSNVLWGGEYDLPEKLSEEDACEKELVRLRKSLSVKEEWKVSECILQDPLQSGEKMGLALMFCLGLRNSEACGANFGDIHPMESDPQMDCLWIFKTTKVGSNIQQFGGKTSNVGRIIPIPQALQRLLEQRRDFLLEMIQNGELVISKGGPGNRSDSADTIVANLPIACVSSNFTKRCSAAILTREGTALLKKVSVSQSMVALLNRDIRRPERTAEGIVEKDPTAYLFRRNLGTHLYLLGLEDSEIQYIIGHEIEDAGEERSFFRNEEKLYRIAQKMARRLIVNDIGKLEQIEIKEHAFFAQEVYRKVLRIPADKKTAKRIRVRIAQREPGKKVEIRLLPERVSISGTHIQYQNEAPYESTLAVMHQYWEVYRRIQKGVEEDENEGEDKVIDGEDEL